MEAPIDLTDDPAGGVDDAVDLRGLSNDDMDDESLDVAIARCREDLEAVSYTHLTLPTIYSV